MFSTNLMNSFAWCASAYVLVGMNLLHLLLEPHEQMAAYSCLLVSANINNRSTHNSPRHNGKNMPIIPS